MKQRIFTYIFLVKCLGKSETMFIKLCLRQDRKDYISDHLLMVARHSHDFNLLAASYDMHGKKGSW